jgi:histidinol-phosphate aminotransferase
LLAAYPNLIITRTFSKAMRGAGLRLGYMCGAPEIIAEVNKIKLPYNINFFSEYVAIKLLEHRRELEETVSFLTAQRDSLYRFLTALPLDKVYPSAANFILIRTGRKDALFASLKERGILVRDVSSYPMLSGCLRINVGTAEENERLRDALSGFFTA